MLGDRVLLIGVLYGLHEELVMPAKTSRQRKAAGADLARVRQGKKPQTFKGMSRQELRKMARKK